MDELHHDDAALEPSMADAAMDRYAAGDDSAFEAIYDAVAPRVAWRWRSLGDRTLAEDIVQQTLLNIHRARGAFMPGAPLMRLGATRSRAG